MTQTPLFELNPAESMFAPFHDEAVSAGLPVTVTPEQATNFRREISWDSNKVRWNDCPADTTAGSITLSLGSLPARFDHYVFCIVLPPVVTVEFFVHTANEWTSLGPPTVGNAGRMEITLPMAGEATAVRAEFTARQTGAQLISLQWWGVADSTLLTRLLDARPRYDAQWTGLVLPKADWPEVKFACGLLFNESDLPRLRKRAESGQWVGHFKMLEERARAALTRQPETEIGDYVPWSDYRYLRQREQGMESWTAEPVLCALVGLVRNDPVLIHHALRYLMCFVHTRNWCQSAESRARGSTWDQRCFLEEMSTTACALIYDWLYFALTDRARDLVRVAIWDKGLSVIQRDMVKWEYVYKMNQGPWFCRARIFGGLVLEAAWPRVRPYVEQAFADMQEGMEHYFQPDGGVDEGVGYFSVTLQAVLPGLLAYAKVRGRPIHDVLPPRLAKSGNFVAIMSAMSPGGVLLDGDNSNDRFTGDTIAILATLYPDDVYPRIARATLLQMRGATYYRQYMVDGPFAFIAAPDELPEPRCIVPVFGQLPDTGQLTSRREVAPGRSVRLHVSGCKARASHTHFDKGAFTLELDDLPVLIDRGMIRYDDLRGYYLKRTDLHNVLTPIRADGLAAEQAGAEQAVIPTGIGDAQNLHATIDLAHVWRQVMRNCEREIVSEEPATFTVRDRGELLEPQPLIFNLHTRKSWTIHQEERRAELVVAGWKLELRADWCDAISQRENLIDHRYEPVWHLQCRVGACSRFDLETRFTCTPL
ncbi:MAG: heparinase II/III family protein [Cephaloticoccus sp.]|nr:heparinase II/III family protein [Cephaloticoccus sp.]